jgi:hypothetical protein
VELLLKKPASLHLIALALNEVPQIVMLCAALHRKICLSEAMLSNRKRKE